jgi:hypothetical protein
MSDEQSALPGSPAYYRERAREMFQRGERTTDEQVRASYMRLAEYWQRLAQQAEHPNW